MARRRLSSDGGGHGDHGGSGYTPRHECRSRHRRRRPSRISPKSRSRLLARRRPGSRGRGAELTIPFVANHSSSAAPRDASSVANSFVRSRHRRVTEAIAVGLRRRLDAAPSVRTRRRDASRCVRGPGSPLRSGGCRPRSCASCIPRSASPALPPIRCRSSSTSPRAGRYR